ncbi:acetate--CoA ligase family protein, partial [Marihabitans asiaticum]
SAAFDATVAEFGVIEAHDIDELIDLAHANTSLPALHGSRAGIVTTSGGAGSLAADLLDASGLHVPEFSTSAQAHLSDLVPEFGAVENPVDVTAQIFRDTDPSDFIDVCRRVKQMDEIDGLLIALTLVTGDFATRTAEALASLVQDSAKPIVVAWAASHEQTADARAHLKSMGLPVYDSVGRAARALASLRRITQPSASPAAPVWAAEVARIVESMDGAVTEAGGRALLAAASIPVPHATLVTDRPSAEAATTQFKSPVVVKIQSKRILHKSEVDGVLVGVPPHQIPDTFTEMMERFADSEPDGVLVQELVPSGPELIVGVTTSNGAVPLVTVGLGGTATELFRDTATTFAPVSAERARALILQTRSSALLTGFRGQQEYDIAAVADVVARVSQLAASAGPRVGELEINPLRISHDPTRPVVALDFLMRLITKEND